MSIKDADFEVVWKNMSEYNFQIVDKVPSNLLCNICKKLLINSRFGPCGCKFCDKCITEYLSTGNEFCPGNGKECRDESLVINSNIWVDHIANRKIMNIFVKCPIEMCSFKCCLKEIGEHINNCRKSSIKCPYDYLGCERITLDGSDLNNHLKLDKDKHIEIMTLKIESVNNENECLRKDIECLQNDSNTQQTLIEDLEKQLEDIKCGFNDKLDEIINNQIEQQKMLQMKLENKQKEIDELKLNFNEYFSANTKEFKFQFSKISEIKANRTRVCSDEFYTHPNGYKLRIEMGYENKYKVYLQMVNGDYNKSKHWPIKLEVTMGIVNETTQDFTISDKRIVEYDLFNTYTEFLSFFTTEISSSSITFDFLTVKCFVKVTI